MTWHACQSEINGKWKNMRSKLNWMSNTYHTWHNQCNIWEYYFGSKKSTLHLSLCEMLHRDTQLFHNFHTWHYLLLDKDLEILGYSTVVCAFLLLTRQHLCFYVKKLCREFWINIPRSIIYMYISWDFFVACNLSVCYPTL